MAYAPPPPPLKRPYPDEWAQSGDLTTQGEWAPPRPAKEAKPPGVEAYDPRYGQTYGHYPAQPPGSVDSKEAPVSAGYPAIEGYYAWPPVEGYAPRPHPAEGYSSQQSAWDDYYAYYYQQRPPAAEAYPPRPPAAEGYPPRPPAVEGYPTRPPAAEAYPPRPPAVEGYPSRPPVAEGYPPRPPAEGYPPRPPPAEGYPPRGPPREDYPPEYPPRGPPREDYPRRGPPRDDYPPRGPPRDDYPPRGPPRDDYPPRGPPRDDYPPRGPPRDDYPPRGPPRKDYPPRGPPREEYHGKDGYDEHRRVDHRGHSDDRFDNRTRRDHDEDRGHFARGQGHRGRGRGDDRGRGRGFERGRGRGDERGRVDERDRGREDHMDRGRGYEGVRGRGDERRGHFSQRRGEGRHIRGRGGMDSSPYKRRFDDDDNDRRPSRRDHDEEKSYRGRGRGERDGDRGRGITRGSYLSGRGRGRYRDKDDREEIHPDKMSLSDKIDRLCTYLRSDKVSGKENAISTIKNGIGHMKIGLQPVFEFVEIGRLVTTAPMFTGTLKIGNLFLARAIRTSKKALKKEVFDKALNVLMTMSTSEIFSLIDPGEETVKEQFEHQIKYETMKCEEEFVSKEKKHEQKLEDKDDNETRNILTRMINAILTMRNVPVSPVAVIEQAVTQSCGLMMHDFSAEAAKMSNGLLFFRGKLSIGSVVIGRGGEITKKKCKIETYNDALQRLRTLSVNELMEPFAEKPIREVRCIGESEENPTLSRMNSLKLTLKHHQQRDNAIMQLDVHALQKGLDPIVIFRKEEGQGDYSEQIVCELYFAKIFITSSKGKAKHDCMTRVYKDAWEVMRNSDIEEMVANNRRITDEEIKDPKLLDVMIKGADHSLESNVPHLRKFEFTISECEKLDMKDMVIVEHNAWSKDRASNAFTILHYSCNQNGLILQMESFTIGNYNRFMVSVQRQVMGDSYGPTRKFSRNLASMDALFKLYETQDVLRIDLRPDDHKKWIPWSTFQDEAESLKEQCLFEEQPSSTEKHNFPQPDQYLMKVLKDKVEKFNETRDEDNDELIIGPGVQPPELREIKLFVKKFNLVCDSFQYQGQIYLLVYEKIPWKKIVELLKNGRNRPYGRYVLVDRKDLPTHKDIAVKLVKTLPKGKPNSSKKIVESDEDSDDEHENVDTELEKVDKPDKTDDELNVEVDNPENLDDEVIVIDKDEKVDNGVIEVDNHEEVDDELKEMKEVDDELKEMKEVDDELKEMKEVDDELKEMNADETLRAMYSMV